MSTPVDRTSHRGFPLFRPLNEMTMEERQGELKKLEEARARLEILKEKTKALFERFDALPFMKIPHSSLPKMIWVESECFVKWQEIFQGIKNEGGDDLEMAIKAFNASNKFPVHLLYEGEAEMVSSDVYWFYRECLEKSDNREVEAFKNAIYEPSFWLSLIKELILHPRKSFELSRRPWTEETIAEIKRECREELQRKKRRAEHPPSRLPLAIGALKISLVMTTTIFFTIASCLCLFTEESMCKSRLLFNRTNS